jgi:hypothetical protein
MRLRHNWLRLSVAITVVLGACEPADRDYYHEIYSFGTYVDDLVRALRLDYALLIDAGGDIRLTPGVRERLKWIDPPGGQ